MENCIPTDEEHLINDNKQEDSYKSRADNAVKRINNHFRIYLRYYFGLDDRIRPINIDAIANNDQMLDIILNQQKRIVIRFELRKFIFGNVLINNLKKWDEILKENEEYVEMIQRINNVKFRNNYSKRRSVICPKVIPVLEFVSLLDANFGENLFPDFTFEDASVIIFFRVRFLSWFDRNEKEYQRAISRYIKYMAFALKKVIEKMENVTIDQFACPNKIKTFSAGQNILIYLNDHYQ